MPGRAAHRRDVHGARNVDRGDRVARRTEDIGHHPVADGEQALARNRGHRGVPAILSRCSTTRRFSATPPAITVGPSSVSPGNRVSAIFRASPRHSVGNSPGPSPPVERGSGRSWQIRNNGSRCGGYRPLPPEPAHPTYRWFQCPTGRPVDPKTARPRGAGRISPHLTVGPVGVKNNPGEFSDPTIIRFRTSRWTYRTPSIKQTLLSNR